MDAWTERVTAAAAEWVYVPDGAPQALTDEYAVVGYPESFTLPTQVSRIRSAAPAADLVAAVDRIAAGWGRADVAWWIDAATTPADLEPYLIANGATLAETVTVLAVDLTRPLPDFAVPAGVVARVADDDEALREFAALEAAAWDTTIPSDDFVTRWKADLDRGEFRVAAAVDGRPGATGGLTLVGDQARLWGGATLPELRGRGAYRAVLAERLRVARDHGATMGLVKGRVTTSAPILRRLGFDVFADERAYRKWTGGDGDSGT